MGLVARGWGRLSPHSNCSVCWGSLASVYLKLPPDKKRLLCTSYIRSLPEISKSVSPAQLTPLKGYCCREATEGNPAGVGTKTAVFTAYTFARIDPESTRHAQQRRTYARSRAVHSKCLIAPHLFITPRPSSFFCHTPIDPNTTALYTELVCTNMRLLRLLCVVMAVRETAMALAPNILVLGGTGFIGSTVSRIAVESGCQVRVFGVSKRNK